MLMLDKTRHQSIHTKLPCLQTTQKIQVGCSLRQHLVKTRVQCETLNVRPLIKIKLHRFLCVFGVVGHLWT